MPSDGCAPGIIASAVPPLQKLTDILAGKKNRMHKVFTDSGIRLGAVRSDIHGKSAFNSPEKCTMLSALDG